MRQINIVSAYSRFKLHAIIYMRVPEALKSFKLKQILLLNRFLYSLKQLDKK